ncbi:MAG: ABC transporter substrate-binding protein [Xanthobacteraceae bacterium]
MMRREFILGVGGAAAWPFAARAQQGERMRRIGVRTGIAETDPVFQDRIAAFRHELQQLGWSDGRNVRIDIRAGSTDPERIRKDVAELLTLAPDVILTAGSQAVGALQQATRTVPIVFVGIVDPVSAGFVASLARPAGNITGFTSFEYGISAKWLEVLKQIDARMTRAAVLRDPANPAGIGLLAAMQGVAPSLGVELTPVGVRDAAEIERAIANFARGSNGGLVVTLTSSTITHRGLISTLAARHRLPAVYPYRYFVTSGGLISYGPDPVDVDRRAAGYVDRIRRGEKPADVPVQAPTKYELVINLKTANALGLQVPATLLARADEVIE